MPGPDHRRPPSRSGTTVKPLSKACNPVVSASERGAGVAPCCSCSIPVHGGHTNFGSVRYLHNFGNYALCAEHPRICRKCSSTLVVMAIPQESRAKRILGVHIRSGSISKNRDYPADLYAHEKPLGHWNYSNAVGRAPAYPSPRRYAPERLFLRLFFSSYILLSIRVTIWSGVSPSR